MQWINVFLAALLAAGLGAGSAFAQNAAEESMEDLLGGSSLEAGDADFPGAVDESASYASKSCIVVSDVSG